MNFMNYLRDVNNVDGHKYVVATFLLVRLVPKEYQFQGRDAAFTRTGLD